MQDSIWTVVIILCLIIFFRLYARHDDIRRLKAKQKAQQPVDLTMIRIKQLGHELRVLTWDKGGETTSDLLQKKKRYS